MKNGEKMFSFSNTEIAFKSRSNKELKMAYWMFKLVSNRNLVSFGKVLLNLAFTLRIPISGVIKSTIFRHFCGGESIEDCSQTINQLEQYNVKTILDYSVEGSKETGSLDQTCDEILATLDKAANNSTIPFSVFKITGICPFYILEKIDANRNLSDDEREIYQQSYQRIEQICSRAQETKTPVFIDAEESWIQNSIDQIAWEMMDKFNRDGVYIYNTVQLYRWDRLKFLKTSVTQAQQNGFGYGVKLVRGAYMEKEGHRAKELNYRNPIQSDKKSTDSDYDKALEFCIQNIESVAICAGTHNEKSSIYLTNLMDNKGIQKNDSRVYFAQLLGMSDHISFNLADAGYNVAKYVPYGPVKEVMPYLIRRAEENTSVAGQTGRELSLITSERSRRKTA